MGETYDEPFLRDLAAALGGGYVRVTEAADVFVAADDMIERVSRPVLSDVRVSFDGFETRDCLPGHMSALPAGSSAVVVGRIEKGGKGSVTVTGSADEQEFTRTYDLSLSPDEEHNRFIPRLWAKAKIDDTESRLGLTGAEGDAGIAREVIDLSVTYQIMSRFTAFLVLESEEDYRTYGIERRTKMIDWTGDEEGIEFNQDGVDLNAPITGSGTAFYGGARGGLAMSRSAAPIVTTEGSGFSVSGPAAFHHFSIDGVIGGDEYFEGMGFPLSGPVGNEALGWYNARGQLDSISDIPLGGTGVVGNLRVGGGASGSFGFRSGGGRRRAALRGGGVRAGSKLKRLSYGYNNYYPQGPLFHRSGDVAGLTLDQPRRASWEYERLLLGKENEADPQRKTELRLNLALACEAAGRNARATRALKRVAEAKPGVPEIQMELAVLAGRSGDWPAMRSAFDAALEAATAAAKAGDNDNKLTQTRQQIGNYLSQLGRYAEAAEMFERLAADEDNAVRAASLYQQAANHRSSQQRLDLSRALWEKALERFPEGAPVLQQAAQWFLGQGQGQDPALALELLGKARELGAKVTPQLAGALARAGRRDEARELVREIAAAAEQQSEVWTALYQLGQHDRAGANEIAMELLGGDSTAHVVGATQYLSSYARGDAKAVEAVLAAVKRNDFPIEARQSVFNMLWNAGRRGPETLAILDALFEDTSTKEGIARAVGAVQATQYQAPREALDRVERLRGILDRHQAPEEVKPYRHQLLSIRWSALQRLGRNKEAEEAMAKVLTGNEGEFSVYCAASALQRARLSRGDLEGAVDAYLKFAGRFPASQYLPQLRQQLRQNLAQRTSGETLEKLLTRLGEKAVEWDGDSPADVLRAAKKLAKEGKFRDGAKRIRAFLPKLHERESKLAEELAGHEAASSGQRRRPDRAASKQPPDDETPEDAAARQKATQAALGARLGIRTVTRQRAILVMWLARIASQDEDLAREFLKDAEERARSEDVVEREWTDGILECLRAAGDDAVYLARLEKLVEAEPDDPLWPARLAYAYLAAKKIDAGFAALSKLFDAEADDAGLAMELHALALRRKDAEAAERFRERAFDALERTPNLLQQYASQWQQVRPEWALEAWRRLLKNPRHSNKGWAAQQAAELARRLGLTGDAVDFYFEAMAAPSSYSGQQAAQQIATLCKEEELFQDVEPRVKKALAEKPEGTRTIYLKLLEYHLAKQRNRNDEATRALDEALRIALPPHDQSTGYALVQELISANRRDGAVKYALEGGGDMTRDRRRQLIRNTASRFQHDQTHYKIAVRLYRKLLEEPDGNSQNDRQCLVRALATGGQLAEAEKELALMQPGNNAWALQSACEEVARALSNRGDHEKAVTLALEAWVKLRRDRQGHGDNMLSSLLRTVNDVFSQQGRLSDEVKGQLVEALREAAHEHFSGGTDYSCLRNYLATCFEKLGLSVEVDGLADKAAESEDPSRVMRAAQYSQNFGRYGDARRRYERALELGANRQTVLNQLYNLAASYDDTRNWGEALELLEKLKGLGSYRGLQYHSARARCLYGLERTDEARREIEKALRFAVGAPHDYGSVYYNIQNLAQHAANAKDHDEAIKLYRVAIRALRATGQLRDHQLYSAFHALADAYWNAGRSEEAIDSLLRGMSLLKSSKSYYRNFLNELRRFVIKDRNLDETVRRYEKEIKEKGLAEKPHLRVFFGDAYEQQGKHREALDQYAVAAELMTKDMVLRRKVVEGYRKLDDLDAAIKACLSWAKLDPQNVGIYKGLGDLYKELGRDGLARAAYSSMAEARPREASGRRAYAKVLMGMKEHEAAARELRKAVRYRPTELDIATELADVYRKLSQDERIGELWTAGERACRQSMKDLAEDPLPWLNLGRFLMLQGKDKEARELYREIIARPWPRFRNETVREARRRLSEL